MSKRNKTIETDASVIGFINSFADTEQKKQDSLKLVELMSKWSGFEAKMWGPSIIGFGSYHYKYASGHEGDSILIGFSPRKAAISLYVAAPGDDKNEFLEKLGKFKMAKSCIYIKKLDDINLDILKIMCQKTIDYISENYECPCRG